MGLFSGKDKRAAEEAAITQCLEKIPVLDEFIRMFSLAGNSEEYSWFHNITGYDDSRIRTFVVSDRYISVFYGEWKTENKRGISLDYTQLGYDLLEPPCNEQGYYVVPLEKLLELWANVVKKRVRDTYTGYTYSVVVSEKRRKGDNEEYPVACFKYVLPEYKWKTWF